MKTTLLRLPLHLAIVFHCGTGLAVTFEWAHVGNAGNLADPKTGLGSVAYDYSIAKTEVTNAQYVEFLNSVAASDPFGLYQPFQAAPDQPFLVPRPNPILRTGLPGDYKYALAPNVAGEGPGGSDYAYANKPVMYITYFDAMRFVNWMHNGQGSGDTETGVYNVSDGISETRSPDAKYWIPSLDEWYKAAYHNAAAGSAGTYFYYPTSSDSPPTDVPPAEDTGNSANFDYYPINYDVFPFKIYTFTDVGAYGLSQSPHGTFDQGGNASEWVEEVADTCCRVMRGGSWDDGEYKYLQSDYFIYDYPDASGTGVGFRIATSAVPEPTFAVLLGFISIAWLLTRRRE
jgi:sulfatase modifying factor 1